MTVTLLSVDPTAMQSASTDSALNSVTRPLPQEPPPLRPWLDQLGATDPMHTVVVTSLFTVMVIGVVLLVVASRRMSRHHHHQHSTVTTSPAHAAPVYPHPRHQHQWSRVAGSEAGAECRPLRTELTDPHPPAVPERVVPDPAEVDTGPIPVVTDAHLRDGGGVDHYTSTDPHTTTDYVHIDNPYRTGTASSPQTPVPPQRRSEPTADGFTASSIALVTGLVFSLSGIIGLVYVLG